MPAATRISPLVEPIHGLPNWTDLLTGRPERARSFYEALLGWEFHAEPRLTAVPDGESQSAGSAQSDLSNDVAVATMDGAPVAEIVGRDGCFEEEDLAPSWSPYVQVAAIDRTLELVDAVGGMVLCPPAERADGARMATIVDPSDALLRIWEPAAATPPVGPGRLGLPSWIELETDDLDSARKFYGEVFGWDASEVVPPAGGDRYLLFVSGVEPVAGAVASTLAGIPASWCTAFAVADTVEATERAVEHGAVVMTEPTVMPMGSQSVLVDPAGALFGLLGPAPAGPQPL